MPRIPAFDPGFGYGSGRGSDNIAEIILRGGQRQAELESRGGDIWSGAIGQIGQNLSGAVTEYGKRQDEKKGQQAVARGLADPTVFQDAIKDLPGPIRDQAIKSYTTLSNSASEIAARNAATEKTRVVTAQDAAALETANNDSMATAGYTLGKHMDSAPAALIAMNTAAHIWDDKKLPGAAEALAQVNQYNQKWQAAQASGDPATAAAAEQEIIGGGKQISGMLQSKGSLSWQEKIKKQEADNYVPVGPGGVLDVQSGKVIGGEPKAPTSLDAILAKAPIGSPEYKDALQKKREEAAAGRDPNAASNISLSGAGLDMAALNYKKTGQLESRLDGGTKKKIMDRAATLTPDDAAKIEAGGLDLAGNRAGYKADSASLTKLQGQTDAVSAFERTANANSAKLEEFAKKIPDAGTTFLNQPVRAAARALGSADQAAFNTFLASVQSEYGRLLTSANLTGVTSDSARHEAQALVAGDLTVEQLMASLKALRTEAANRHTEYKAQLAEIKGRGKEGTGSAGSSNDPLGIR